VASVETVLGPVDVALLGPTSVHEHLFIDLECWFDPPATAADAAFAESRVAPETIVAVRSNPFAVRDNLHLDDPVVAAMEIGRFKAAGGRTIVDLTVDELGREPRSLRRLAERTGLTIIMGCGHYIARAHPPSLAERGVDALAADMVRDLTIGVDGVRAGVIGEIGTSDPVDEAERVVLAAACRAQRATGVALYVHLDPWGRAGHEVLDICAGEGVALDRVVLCHLDPSLPDAAYARGLALRGAWVAIDIWGDEDAYGGRGMPTDVERAAAVRLARDEGWLDRVLVAQDVCLKSQLRAFGGRGYDHLLTGLPALLADAGLSDTDVRALLVDHPRRLLGGEPPAEGGGSR
jgi:phosphotriesterase-related protein